MLRRDDVQVRMEIDGKQAISELGKQELAAYEYRQEIKQIKEEQSTLEKESKNLDKIRERYDKLTKRIQELDEAGKSNTKTYKNAVAQLGKVSGQLQSAEKATKDLAVSQAKYNEVSAKLDGTKAKIAGLREQMGIAGMTMRQLRQYQRELTQQIDVGTTRGTQKYHELKTKLNEVNRAINAQKADVNGLNSAWVKVRSEITKFGVLALGYLGAQELIGKVQNLIKGSAELSDALSDVQKTTGLTKDEVRELSREFGQMNTRTARKELLGMAEIAGRLGIKGKKDIEGFVNAADKVNVALGDVLGDVEKVMRDMGKLTSTYNIQEAYGIEQSILKVGSAINELGMSSTASEAYIVEFTRRMGGIAPLAKISIENIMGLAATLDSLGQTSEVSTTALSKLFIAMAKNPKEFARFAKMEMADFVKLLNEDANEAFLRMLEGVKDNSNGITELAESLGDLGQDGGRVVGVLGVLANNTKLLRDQQNISNQAFKEGTSVTNEFALKNENLAASLAKVQRWINQKFINSAFLGFLENSVGKMADWVVGIDKATRAFENQEKYVQRLRDEIPNLMYRYDTLVNKTEKTSAEQEELRQVTEKLAKLVPQAVTEWDKYGKAMGINTNKVHEFTKAQAAAMRVLNEDAIKEQEKNLKNLEVQISKISIKLNRRDEDGDLFKQVSSGSGLAWKNVKLTADEINNLTKSLNDLQDKRLGVQTILEDLKGIVPSEPEESATPQVTTDEPAITDFVDKEALDRAKAEFEKLIQEYKNLQESIAQLEKEAELGRMDKDSQEIARIEAKFETLRDKARQYYESGVIDRQTYDETIAALDDLQNEQVSAKIDEQSEKIKDQRKKLAEDIELIVMDDFDRQQAATAKKFDDLIAQAQEHGLSVIDLEKAKLEALEALNFEHNRRLADDARKINQERMQDEIMVKQALIDINMEYSRIAGAAIDFVGNKSGQLNAFQKILALTQIGIDTGAAIMKAELVALQAASVGGPAAPFIYKATKLSVLGSILSAASRAKNLLSDSGDVSWGATAEGPQAGVRQERSNSGTTPRRSYFFGGDTSGPGLGFGDQHGEYKGYVHDREYVIPEVVRRDPVVKFQIEPILEALRMKQSPPSFYYGGPTGEASGQSSPAMSQVSDMESKALLSEIREMKEIMRQWPKTVRGQWVYNDWEEMHDEMKALEKRYKV